MPRPNGQYVYLGDAIASNGERGPFRLDGPHVICFRGSMGGATLSFYHKVGNGIDPDALGTVTVDPELTFTTLQPPFKYDCSEALPLYFSVANAGGGTNLNISAYRIGTTK